MISSGETHLCTTLQNSTIWRNTGLQYKAGPRLRECCRQVEGQVVSKRRNKIHQTWEWPCTEALCTGQVLHIGRCQGWWLKVWYAWMAFHFFILLLQRQLFALRARGTECKEKAMLVQWTSGSASLKLQWTFISLLYSMRLDDGKQLSLRGKKRRKKSLAHQGTVP